tara:strand:- start:868 stop:2466 length:1599 start_codon:yes stop_codon:yes gene_type:complete
MTDGHNDDVASITFENSDDSVVVIIGSGAGGGTLANELAQKGIRVVVLEAGPRRKITDFVNDEHGAYDMLTWHDRRTSTGNSPVVEKFKEAPTWLAKGVGGTTQHWAGQAVRFQEHEFRARTTYGHVSGTSLIDWPISLEEMLPFYDRAEQKMGVSGTHGMPHLPESNVAKVFMYGARRAGYTKVSQINAAVNSIPRDGRNACDQIGFCMQGCKSGAKWSTLYTEIPMAEATGYCEVRPESMALEIQHNDSGRITGVTYVDRSGIQHVQKARAVCIAGNSVETSRILLNSATPHFPDGLANTAGHVGRNYMRNMFAFLYGIFDRPVNMHRGYVCPGIVRDESEHNASRGFPGGFYLTGLGLGLPYHAAFLDPGGWGKEFSRLIEGYQHTCGVVALGEDMPMESNNVTLHPTDKDQHGLPVPVLNMDSHPTEIILRNYAHKCATKILESAGANTIIECPPMPSTHNLGACRMSEKPDDGVCNRWGQTHDISNLFISDGSQFSSNNAGNPTLTIVALAIRQAEYIAGHMGNNEF